MSASKELKRVQASLANNIKIRARRAYEKGFAVKGAVVEWGGDIAKAATR